VTKVEPSFRLALLDKDEMTVDVVSLMAVRMGGAVAVYYDVATALSNLGSYVPDVLVVEPRLLHGALRDFVEALPPFARDMHIVVMTDLSADDLRSGHLPICWEGRLRKPFTFECFRRVIAPLLGHHMGAAV
jgi:DNA-binding response OmpR family regulator